MTSCKWPHLQEVISLLEHQQTLSSPGHLLLALAKIQLTDLKGLAAHVYLKEKGEPITKHNLAAYSEAQQILLNQVIACSFGFAHLWEKCKN